MKTRWGGRGCIQVALTAPAWPTNRGEDQGAQLPGSGGALASRIFAKIHPVRTPKPDDANIRKITQGGTGRGTETQRDP